jgi:hypothetical protein
MKFEYVCKPQKSPLIELFCKEICGSKLVFE